MDHIDSIGFLYNYKYRISIEISMISRINLFGRYAGLNNFSI